MRALRFELAFLQEEVFTLEFDHGTQAEIGRRMITFVRLSNSQACHALRSCYKKRQTSRARLQAILKYILVIAGIRVLLQIATTQPEKNVQEIREYDLSLDVDYTGLKYSGKVTVDLESIGDVSLNAVGQQINGVTSGSKRVPFKHDG